MKVYYFKQMYPLEKQNNLFILSHMRSRSTLLSHILMNNDNVFGIGESNKVYSSKCDLLKMRLKTRLKHRQYFPSRFIFVDQINHNRKTPNLDLISSHCKFLFLAREPNATFESIKNLTSQYYKEWSHDQIEDYYLSRLQFLNDFKERLPDSQSVTINADEIVVKPKKTLSKISSFVRFVIKPSEPYATYSFTGIHGDPSQNIKSGTIVSTQSNHYDKSISKFCFDEFYSLMSLT